MFALTKRKYPRKTPISIRTSPTQKKFPDRYIFKKADRSKNRK